MSARGNIFEIGWPVHIISRTIEGKRVFQEEADCFRFIFQIYAANIGKPIFNLWRHDVIKIAQAIIQGEKIPTKFIIKEHAPLVDFLDFSLVINHNHFYLVPRFKNSIPILMRNLNSGFAQYFNLKYKRRGTLFDGRYRVVVTKTQFQADAVSRYISVINPLDVFQPGWREDGLKDSKKAFIFLKNYQFSSFPDQIGERRSKILAPSEILEKYLTIDVDMTTYQQFVEDFLNERSNSPREFCIE